MLRVGRSLIMGAGLVLAIVLNAVPASAQDVTLRKELETLSQERAPAARESLPAQPSAPGYRLELRQTVIAPDGSRKEIMIGTLDESGNPTGFSMVPKANGTQKSSTTAFLNESLVCRDRCKHHLADGDAGAYGVCFWACMAE
jgi:hypothetical protein